MKRNPFLLVFFAIIAVSVNAQTEITTAEQFRNLNLDGDYKLMADIDLTKGNYVPIGGKNGYFNGTFDGNGHTIRIRSISDDYQYRGLFSQVGSEGVIKNLKVSGQMDNSMSVSSRVGGIAGRNDGMIINCFSSVHVNCSGVLNNQPRSQTGGGIAGVNTGTISYCVAAGSIMGASYSGGIGGIVGVNYSNNSGKIDNCIYGGDAIDILENTSTSYYGMICGDVHDNSWANNVSNCYYKTNDALTGLGSSGRRVSDELRCTPLDQEEFRALVAEDGIYASTEYDVFQKSILKAVAPYYYLNFDTQLTDGYSTFYNGDCGYSFDSDGTIYTGVIKDSRILLTALEGRIIPKGVPVVIRSKKRYFSLYKTYDEVSFTGNNDLKGTNTDFACQPNTKYVLSSEDGDIGFGLFNGNTIKANTAYIPWQEAIDDYEFLSILTIEPSPAITFADNIVKAICVANWDYNGDGELNEGEAAAVNDLGQVFKGNTEIISFNELRFFTGLNSIGDYQFSGCSNLKEIMFPPNISSIGKGAFGSTGFERIDIPEGISSIGKEAFARCNNLIRVSLPSTMQTIGNYAFAWSDNRLSVIFSSATPPTLKTAPFYSTYVKSVAYVPIGSKAEYEGYNSYFDKIIEINTELLPLLPQTLTSNIPSTKTYGDATFTLPNITDEGVAITWTTTNTQVISISSNNITIKNAGTTVITAKNDGSNDYLPFSQEFTLTVNKAPLSITANDKTKMKGEDIPELTISYEGFKYNDDSSVLTMQPTVTTTATKDSPIGIYPIIVNGAASNNYEITHINGNLSVISPIIPFVDANVKAICVENWDTDGDGELSEDEAAAVTDLGEVFKENKSITSFDELRYFSQLTSIGNYAFKDCSNLTSVTIPNSVSTIGESSFHRCWALNSVDIPNSVISIGGYAFYNCVGLKSLIIPNSVTSIGASAFSMCDNLASITIPSSVTSIGSYAFGGTKWFNNQPDGLVYAGKVAYQYKGTMAENTNLILDEGTLGIAGDAFSGCTSLSSISLPNGLKVIGASAFYGCTSLTTVIAEMNLPISISEDVFPNRSNIALFVPNGCKIAYEAADYWKDFGCILEQGTVLTENNSIYAEDASVYIGYTADLQINMSNEDTFTAYQFDLVLPNGITLAKDEKGKYIVTLSNRHSDNTHQVTIDDIGDNTFRFVCVSLNTSVINGNDGTILTVSLKANNGIAEGELNATIKNVILTTADETKMKPKDSSFKIKTKTLLKGDADGDGEIDVTDVVSTINYIIGNPSAKFNFLAADLNEDGEVDIFDVMMAINLVFSQKNSSRSQTRATSGSEEQAIVKAADDRIIFGVNDASRFTAFQFDVEVTNGIELKEVCLNADAHHDLQFVRIGQDSYRVIGISMDNSTLTTNGNDFVELRLSKECDAQISNIVFVTPEETKVHFAGSYVNLTDIRNTTLDQSEEIFDLSGRKIDAERSRLPKGVYIINNKKVVKK